MKRTSLQHGCLNPSALCSLLPGKKAQRSSFGLWPTSFPLCTCFLNNTMKALKTDIQGPFAVRTHRPGFTVLAAKSDSPESCRPSFQGSLSFRPSEGPSGMELQSLNSPERRPSSLLALLRCQVKGEISCCVKGPIRSKGRSQSWGHNGNL